MNIIIMLVATPGQTTSFLHGNVTKICQNSDASSSSSHKSQQNNKRSFLKVSEASSTVSAATAFMKTLSVRLNRGNEYLKNAVHKALSSSNNLETTSRKYKNTNSNNCVSVSPFTSAKVSLSLLNSKPATVLPTLSHRYPQRTLSNDSTDSLYREMCHFKPIRSAPTTPWKCGSKSRGASFRVPKPLLAKRTKIHLSNTDGSLLSPDSIISSPIIVTPIEFSVPSAFVCLNAQIRDMNSAARRIKQAQNFQTEKRSAPRKKTRKIRKTRKTIKSVHKSTPINLLPSKNLKSNINQMKANNIRPRPTISVTATATTTINLRKRKATIENHVETTTKTQKFEKWAKPGTQRKLKLFEHSSPPLTRSRLKQRVNKKLNSALTYNGRPI